MSSEGTPLHSDRGAWNVITFDTEHAKDIMDSTLRRHLPLPGAAGGYARSDGTDWQRVNSIALADLADYSAGFIIVGGAADWEAAAFDWDTLSAGAGADMVHGHGSAAEGGTLGFDILTGDCDLADLADYACGSIIRGGAAGWEAYAHPGAAGRALISTATDIVWDVTPTWLGSHCFKQGIALTGNSGINIVTIKGNAAKGLHIVDNVIGGACEYLALVTTTGAEEVVVNELGYDLNFRVEAVGQSNAFNLRGSDGHIGIGYAPNNQRYLYLRRTITDPAAAHYAMQMHFEATATANNAQDLYAMAFSMVTANVAHNFGTLYGVQGSVAHFGSGTVTRTVGVWAGARVYGAGDITVAESLRIHSGFGGGTGDIGTNYSILIKNPLGTGAGTITGNNFALYIDDQTRGATNYAIYCGGGRSYHAGTWAIGANQITAQLFVRQPSTTAGIPVQILDQRDVSEPFTNYIGTSAASAANSLSSWTTGNAVQGHVQIDVNGAKKWLRYYDDPTS